jgi:hypothetical protein
MMIGISKGPTPAKRGEARIPNLRKDHDRVLLHGGRAAPSTVASLAHHSGLRASCGFTLSSQELEPQAQTLQKPALRVNGYNLYAGWTDKSTDDLFYASAENPY